MDILIISLMGLYMWFPYHFSLMIAIETTQLTYYTTMSFPQYRMLLDSLVVQDSSPADNEGEKMKLEQLG